ncbi:DHHC palmitoyltransferase-domain-containing protein [Lipomyces tetrasporus]|uniref:Palmitoyltransferase n=1 Tax=Lipomyces tetrasporus TaxID=54092 RepID=A0AAD7QTX6_9ASCO|nr:DHHC palmitoyltransferase-domain-containing protein [Lipomyces tetrasporus]KAJ8099647.1 DHHC palmitoyltransferase-domain-containing protein [Lipomyces tetrasporus]
MSRYPRDATVGKKRACSAGEVNAFCCSLATLFPRVFVNVLLTWAAYVLVVDIGVRTLEGFGSAVVVVFGTGIYVLCVSSYVLIVWYAGIGPSRSEMPGGDEEPLETDLEAGRAALLPQGVLAKENGRQRYCSKCRCFKPDRTHHCSTCGTCVLRMDHHCPWFSSCIGFDNHKYFILFLIYVVVFCLVSFFASGIVLLDWIDRSEYLDTYISLNWVFLFIISIIFGIAVLIFLCYQLYLLFTNKTTIEAMETQRYKSSVASSSYRYSEPPSSESVGNVFDLGWRENFREVMGDNPWTWFWPIRTSKGNGMTFPTNPKVVNAIRRQAEQEAHMLSSLQGFLDRRGESSSLSNSSAGRSSNVVIANVEDELTGRVSVEFRPSERRHGN